MTAPEASLEPDFASPGSPRYSDVAHDLEYIRRWSFGFDLRIIWLTVFGRGVRQNAY
ncbi:MAG: hypothetical protein ABUL60_01340 [Myxococcales bacterium]